MTHEGPSTDLQGPVPPRSRSRAHLLGLALAVVGGPITFGALALAVEVPASFGDVPGLDLLPVALACLGLAITALAVMRSSVGAAVAGGAWFLAGVVGLLMPGQAELLVDLVPEQALGSAPRAGADLLLRGGGALAIGSTLGAAAIAATIARRRGRSAERTEQAAISSGDVTRPPRSRLAAHIVAPILSLALALLGLQILSGTETAALWSIAPTDGLLADPVPWIVTVLVLAATTLGPPMLGAWSSLGPAAAALLWLSAALDYLVDAIDIGWWAPGGGVGSLLAPLSPDVTTWAVHAAGLSLAVGSVLVGAAVGIHYARRDGRAHERREYRLARQRELAA
ncbi:MAG: hypothetical protein J0H73_13775 [Salana multivorans]|uniref:hypothetical protein n=1 Tax=Salana multivorans TaxID=120377 RepID=UPI000962DE8D|nr:hypothetical protein [Salana multivorans]MBN8883369.1 hypothetical protein [Salana multivorans]OJX97435.1 MAG: hypothetical protein BGO96_05875 [Micrococcales bacterium 73-15]